jgi:hypothetical protein
MPTKTLYMNKTTGALMITDYVSDDATRASTLASRLANPNSNLSTVSFHTDFEFIKILDELELSSASFSSQGLSSRSWDTGGGGCC